MRGQEARLGRWLDLVGELLRQPLAELPHQVINDELAASFDACATCWHSVDGEGRHVLHARPPSLTMRRLASLRPLADTYPIVRWYARTRSLAPQTLGRVPRAIADERCVAVWAEASRPFGVTEQLCIPLHIGAHEHRVFVAARPDRDFCTADVELARRLQHLLMGLERQADELAHWRRATAVPQPVGRPGPGSAPGPARTAVEAAALTGRELAVLSLLAEGMTAVAIGRRLGITPRTVHKHLEHLYAKLGTADRLSTVLQAQRHGLLPVRHPRAG
jgi:DNA-binding CsgD family transcriptional regulator